MNSEIACINSDLFIVVRIGAKRDRLGVQDKPVSSSSILQVRPRTFSIYWVQLLEASFSALLSVGAKQLQSILHPRFTVFYFSS